MARPRRRRDRLFRRLRCELRLRELRRLRLCDRLRELRRLRRLGATACFIRRFRRLWPRRAAVARPRRRAFVKRPCLFRFAERRFLRAMFRPFEGFLRARRFLTSETDLRRALRAGFFFPARRLRRRAIRAPKLSLPTLAEPDTRRARRFLLRDFPLGFTNMIGIRHSSGMASGPRVGEARERLSRSVISAETTYVNNLDRKICTTDPGLPPAISGYDGRDGRHHQRDAARSAPDAPTNARARGRQRARASGDRGDECGA